MSDLRKMHILSGNLRSALTILLFTVRLRFSVFISDCTILCKLDIFKSLRTTTVFMFKSCVQSLVYEHAGFINKFCGVKTRVLNIAPTNLSVFLYHQSLHSLTPVPTTLSTLSTGLTKTTTININ